MLTSLRYFALGRQASPGNDFEFMSTGGASNTAGPDRAHQVSRVRPEPSAHVNPDGKEGTLQVQRAGFRGPISRTLMPSY